MTKNILISLAVSLFCATAVLGVGTVAAETSPPPIAAPAEHTPKIVTWVEINSMDAKMESGETYRQCGINSLLMWSTVVDEAIVTTNPHLDILEPVLSECVAELAPMQVRGGVQIAPVVGYDIGNIAGWKRVAVAVEETCRITGQRKFVIDVESTISRLLAGDRKPDWDRVRAGLELLPKDVAYTWFPAPWVPSHPGQADYEKFLSFAAKVLPNLTIVTFEVAGPAGVEYPEVLAKLARVRKLYDCPTTPIAYCGPPLRWGWQVDQVIDARDHCNTPEVLVYPCAANWVKSAHVVPLQLRQELEQRLTVAQDAAGLAVQRASDAEQRAIAAERLVAVMRQRAAAAEESLSHACDVLHDFSATTSDMAEGVAP